MLKSKLGHCFVACVHANLVNYADLTSENTQNGTLSWKLGQMPPRTQLNFFWHKQDSFVSCRVKCNEVTCKSRSPCLLRNNITIVKVEQMQFPW